MSPLSSAELMDEIVADATIDRVMRKVPPITEQDLEDLIHAMRSKRAMFIENEAGKKAKKELGDDDE